MIKLKNIVNKILLESQYDKNVIIGYYNDVCKSENINPLLIKFMPIKKGEGAMVEYDARTFKPDFIGIDLARLKDPEAAILHELAHQILLQKKQYPGHGNKFTNILNKLHDKYMYSNITFKWFK